MFNLKVSARVFNSKNHYSLSIPMFFQVLRKDIREDLIEHFKDHNGKWNPVTKMWDFEPHTKLVIFKILQGFNIQMTMPGMAEAEAQEKSREPIIAAPTRTLVQVPVQLIGPSDPQVIQVLQRQYERLTAEFRKLHEETGVCKTKMRELLQNAVPAMAPIVFKPTKLASGA